MPTVIQRHHLQTAQQKGEHVRAREIPAQQYGRHIADGTGALHLCQDGVDVGAACVCGGGGGRGWLYGEFAIAKLLLVNSIYVDSNFDVLERLFFSILISGAVYPPLGEGVSSKLGCSP